MPGGMIGCPLTGGRIPETKTRRSLIGWGSPGIFGICPTRNGPAPQPVPAALRLRLLTAIGLVVQGEDRCLDAVLQAEFGEDAADVGFDGLLADRQAPAIWRLL
jgi:hypothetical protein